MPLTLSLSLSLSVSLVLTLSLFIFPLCLFLYFGHCLSVCHCLSVRLTVCLSLSLWLLRVATLRGYPPWLPCVAAIFWRLTANAQGLLAITKLRTNNTSTM